MVNVRVYIDGWHKQVMQLFPSVVWERIVRLYALTVCISRISILLPTDDCDCSAVSPRTTPVHPHEPSS